MKIVNANKKRSVTEAAQAILDGGVIVYPTETIYGLGANALEPKIVERVFTLKERNKSNSILVLIPDKSAVEELTLEVGEVAEKLMSKFWPGPLTLVFRAAPIVSKILTAGSGKIGIRLSSDEFCRELLNICKIPITSTSANLSGEPNPNSINMINKKVLGAVDLIVDAGTLSSQTPSTVVDVTKGKIVLVREGAIEYNKILEAV
ncbi:MAG TPA: L-threonylcarbamoyladenylate synthase [Candidatus Acidoferrales bacterium]|nr:L-threonylcarbamoyladenylate synthase [Candidatus Acidoferrales bacterium]